MAHRQPHLALELGATAGPEHVAAAEAAGFALVTIDDTPGAAQPEAGVRAAYLARRTRRIALAPTLHATVTEPFHLATQLASLDHASLGRGAWVVGAAAGPAAYATVGLPLLDGAALRREIADVIDVARRLWDSWEDDAIIRDVPSGRFLDADRVHHVNFTGERFSVVGPLITPRPPQGQLVVLGADTLGVTDRLDIALIPFDTVDALSARAGQARTDGAPLVFADLDLAVAGDDPAGLIDRLGRVVDGVRLHLGDIDADLPRIAATLSRPPVTGPTLRDTLGLPRPVNQFA
ncbi:Alkanesulfonate monooxygenase [Actinoplanes sp. SE50]|uniref:LLM class flavin-dependent oxidoreductase n=1 Tax=unclassified Actinoplanes TaxID=2626549 RepID=UPI00023EC0CA|nr:MULTISPECIES: LLM class flavin-dependent oxidoreductase [unclassified Actinoplanes]AEV84067.1 Alkanesulfonate monooxygenase [Actinoplanes sp. SE50/110]ATO82459.1 Alkanesulfonate monooxygenase [Actinoplanes sp. SE50]SLL99866.1 alkanesulfonate monooxygenase [Actinoplanes sp. SE50/110]